MTFPCVGLSIGMCAFDLLRRLPVTDQTSKPVSLLITRLSLVMNQTMNHILILFTPTSQPPHLNFALQRRRSEQSNILENILESNVNRRVNSRWNIKVGGERTGKSSLKVRTASSWSEETPGARHTGSGLAKWRHLYQNTSGVYFYRALQMTTKSSY